MWLAFNSPCLPGFVCLEHKYSSETRRVLLISRVLYEADNEPETCAALFVLARKFPHVVAAPAAVELLIKALADGMFGYILKAACLLLYYACLCMCVCARVSLLLPTLRMSNACTRLFYDILKHRAHSGHV